MCIIQYKYNVKQEKISMGIIPFDIMLIGFILGLVTGFSIGLLIGWVKGSENCKESS